MTGTQAKRRVPPAPKKSRKPTSDGPDRSPIGIEPKMRQIIEDAFFGSKNLCAAILASGRTHGPMTPEQEIAAIQYAHSVKITDSMVQRVSSIPPRTLRLADWNLSK